MKLKKLITLLIASILSASVLFTAGCSEADVDALVSVASEVIAEEEAATADGKTETTAAQESSVTQTEETSQQPTEAQIETEEETDTTAPPVDEQIPESGEYLSMEQVATYLHLYGHLPDNYLTKSEAKKLGWVPSEGNLWEVAPGCAIGGDKFGNREKLLPSKKGRKYYECDVNYDGGERGAERIVYSNDGLIYYTDNHYEDFMMLFDGSE